MVFPNFFITFVRHSFHTSPTLHIPLSRETASPCHQAPHSPHGTCAASRAAPRKGAMLTRHAHATHPRPSHHTRPPPPAKGYATHTPHAQKCRNAFPCSPLLSKKKERASTTKILHITILHVTFTRIGVKTTQKSEAIFSFID